MRQDRLRRVRDLPTTATGLAGCRGMGPSARVVARETARSRPNRLLAICRRFVTDSRRCGEQKLGQTYRSSEPVSRSHRHQRQRYAARRDSDRANPKDVTQPPPPYLYRAPCWHSRRVRQIRMLPNVLEHPSAGRAAFLKIVTNEE